MAALQDANGVGTMFLATKGQSERAGSLDRGFIEALPVARASSSEAGTRRVAKMR